MAQAKFKVGDKVKIVSNDIQSNMVGKIGQIKKVYAIFQDNDKFVYRVEVNGIVLKGVALESDIETA